MEFQKQRDMTSEDLFVSTLKLDIIKEHLLTQKDFNWRGNNCRIFLCFTVFHAHKPF